MFKKLDRLVTELFARCIDEKKDRALSNMLGILPATDICAFLDEPELRPEIWKYRTYDIFLSGLREGVNAFSTVASFLLGQYPLIFSGSVAFDYIVSQLSYYPSKFFNREIETKVRDKLYSNITYHDVITAQIESQGIQNPSMFMLEYQIGMIEKTKTGVEYSLLMARPFIQSCAALVGGLSLPIVGTTFLASYGMLPLFAKLGKNDKLLRDKKKIVNQALAQAKIYGDSTLVDPLKQVQEKLWKEEDKIEAIRKIFRRGGDFLLMSARLAGISSDEYLGVARFGIQMFSLQLEYRELRNRLLENQENLGSAKAILKVMSGKPLLLTERAWDDYRFIKLASLEQKSFDQQGIHVDIQTKIPDMKQERYAPRLNCVIVPGYIYQLHAPSGMGKSVSMGLGLTGVIESKGTVYFTDKDGTTRFMEEFTKDELEKRVFFISQTSGIYYMRICDIYQKRVAENYLSNAEKHKSELTEAETLMISMPDSALEKQLWILASKILESGDDIDLGDYGDLSKCEIQLDPYVTLFSKEDFLMLKKFREDKLELVTNYLREKGGNFSQINAYQSVIQLSAGMRVRFASEYHREINKSNYQSDDMKMIIFDEPLGHLDEKSAIEFLNAIAEEQKANTDTGYVIISQDKQNLIDRYIGNRSSCSGGSMLKHIYFENHGPRVKEVTYLAE